MDKKDKRLLFDEYNQKIEELSRERDKALDEQMGKTFNYSKYEDIVKPYNKKIMEWSRQQRMNMKCILEDPVDIDDHLMKIEDFIKACQKGFFINYDGYGCYVKDGKKTNIEIYPSDIKCNSIRKEFKEIVWFNR